MQAAGSLPHHSSVYQIIREQIIQRLESGVPPWHRPAARYCAALTETTGRTPFPYPVPVSHSLNFHYPFPVATSISRQAGSTLLAVNEEGCVGEFAAPIPGSRPDPNAIAPPPPGHAIVSPTPERRRKGPYMSRRRGQTGYVWQKDQNENKKWDSAAPAYGQVWIDVPGKERQRKFYPLGVCRTKSEAKRRLKEMIERDGINSTVEIVQTIDSVTFHEQAEWWIKAIEDGRVLHRRKRTRIKPATIDGYKCAINWLSPHIGKTPLANIKNAAAKELVAKMKQAGLSDKTIVSYFQILQSVIASVVNDEGEQVHRRTWDSHFIGLPVVNPKKQNRPTRTAKEIEKIIAASRNRYRVLYSLLAGSGLRIGEALALKIGQHISDNCSTIHVRQSLWRRKEQEPKTQAAVRDVDITKELAALLANFIGDRKEGYLFRTETGKPLSPRNILRDSLHPNLAKLKQPKMGFHCFRRFRESVLQKSEARALLVDYWMGHENREMGTRYAKQLVEDVAWRKQWAKKVGLGFKLTDLQLEIGQLGQLSVSKTQPAKAA